MLRNGFAAFACGDRGTVFFPDVSNQTKAGIADGFFRRAGEENSSPAFVLIDVERPLVEASVGLRVGILGLPG